MATHHTTLLLLLACVSTLATHIREKRQKPCGGKNEYRCGSSECISRFQICDSTNNCRDKSDESPSTCSTISDNCKIPKRAQGTNYRVIDCSAIPNECSKDKGKAVVMSCQDGYSIPSTLNTSVTLTCPSVEWNHGLSQCISCGQTEVQVKPGNPGPPVKTSIEQHPWHVAIYKNKKNLCGGTIITIEIVMTAAVCVFNTDGRTPDPKEYKVIAGRTKYGYNPPEPNSQEKDVESIIINSAFNGEISSYAINIGFLKVKTKFEFNRFVQPVCIHSREKGVLPEYGILTVAGWGLKPNGPYNDDLMESNHKVEFIKTCRRRSRIVVFDRFFAYDKFCLLLNPDIGSGFLEQDTGSGIIYNLRGVNYLYGIVSAKIAEHTNFSLVTNVTKHIKWIRSTVDTMSIDLKCPKNSFNCPKGGCIKMDLVCNGKEDCEGGFDEDPKNCDQFTIVNKQNACNLPDSPDSGNLYHYIDCSDDCNIPPGSSVPQGSVITTTCKDGYDLPFNKNEQYACHNKKFYPAIHPCQKLCKPLVADYLNINCVYNGNLVSCNNSMFPNTKVTYSCKSKYLIENPALFRGEDICMATGSWKYVLGNCVPTCGKTAAVGVAQQLISKGQEAKQGNYPWHVGLYKFLSNEFSHICGGSIVSPGIVLTAAHCVWEANTVVNTTSLNIVAGKFFREYYTVEEAMQVRNVKKIIVPERYASFRTNYEYDIALIQTEVKFELNNNILPVCILWDHKFTIDDGNVGTVVGWGLTENNIYSPTLLEVKLPYLRLTSCRSKYYNSEFFRFLTYDKFCVTYIDGSGTQRGDSGGGYTMILDKLHFVVGVVSVKPSQSNTFAAFTNIFAHLDWLRETIDSIESQN